MPELEDLFITFLYTLYEITLKKVHALNNKRTINALTIVDVKEF